MSKPKVTAEVSALLKRLIKEYRACFKREGEEPLPHAHGIHWAILAAVYPDVPPLVVRDALRVYTDRPAYQAVLKPGATRVNLKGEPAGTVENQRAPQAAKPVSSKNNRKPVTSTK